MYSKGHMRRAQLTQWISPWELKLKWCPLSGVCWRLHDSCILIYPCSAVIDISPRGRNSWTWPPLPDHVSPHLPSILTSSYLPPISATFQLSGWHHHLWQENKSVSGHLRLASEGRPWQLSINSPRFFFFFLLPFFNLLQQTLESCCQHNGSILAGLAPPGPVAPRPVPSL